MKYLALSSVCLFLSSFAILLAQSAYPDFNVSIYTRAREVNRMADTEWLESTWEKISSHLHVDKIYLETHRDRQIIEEDALKKLITFFKSKGLEVAGGITLTIDESNNFETFCYSNPEHRRQVKEIVELTAANFDELILDDFFFTSCKCGLCIDAKGPDRSWSDYRLELMTGAAKDLIIGPAKAINPDIKVVVKYPNWYDHFHELGFNLETQPKLFDGVYTGTETRDDVMSDQHLQPYLGYLVWRYFNNLKPGGNGGGWVDTYGSPTFDRYAEQLWQTLLAKTPEMTLFEYSAMAGPMRETMVANWKDQQTSFQYNGFLPIKEGEPMAKAAAHALDQIAPLIGKLGTPYGIKSYKPYHSTGEDFLQNFFGMIGIPMDLVPEFPMEEEGMIILTEQAKKDPEIVQKIEQRLRSGKDVMITSGLLNALQDRGLQNVVNLEYTSRKAAVDVFKIGWSGRVEGERPILIPQIEYFTNDSWEVISGLEDGLGWPIVHRGAYADANLYLLTIPENYHDLYAFPDAVLNRIREIICGSMDIRLTGPSKVSFYTYDNDTFVVESFRDEAVSVEIISLERSGGLKDLLTGEEIQATVIPARMFFGRTISPEMYSYKITLPPHSFRGGSLE
ncbi:MAG: hypothetical protein KDD15_27370 [Lewinella sp.]|nr:hypothetical protein [Lewinella sp.]